MSMIQVKPAPGKKVRSETGPHIPETGMKVPNTSYYRRRIKDGDLLDVAAKDTTKATAKTAAKATNKGDSK